MIRRTLALSLLVLCRGVAACSPPGPADESGFLRHAVNHLPRNAAGVMFAPAAKAPKAADFRVVSADDKRPLTLRVRTFAGKYWVRLELVHGFQPGARYEFRYMPAHGNWRHPDRQTVTIDAATATTAGSYALALAPEAVTRVVSVPTGRGSCWEPAVALAQEFTYTIPPQLAPYRDVLAYDIDYALAGPKVKTRAPAVLVGWPHEPEPYARNGYLLGAPWMPAYTESHNAVVAACGASAGRGELRGRVSFPEVDEHAYRTAAVAFDLKGRAGPACEPVAALDRSMRERGAERALREACGLLLGMEFSDEGKRLDARPPEEWERSLDFPYGLALACNLVALGHLGEQRQWPADPASAARIGTALGKGLETAARMPGDPDFPPALAQAVHGLHYVLSRLPAERRATVTQALLAPALPTLVEALAEPVPVEPAGVARLIAAAGLLPPPLHARMQAIAGSGTAAAPHARGVLAALGGGPR